MENIAKVETLEKENETLKKGQKERITEVQN